MGMESSLVTVPETVHIFLTMQHILTGKNILAGSTLARHLQQLSRTIAGDDPLPFRLYIASFNFI